MRLAACGLQLRYGRRVVVHGLDLTAAPGEVLAILGANGSGKSTLLRGLAGLLPFDGTIRSSIGRTAGETITMQVTTGFDKERAGHRTPVTRAGRAPVHHVPPGADHDRGAA